MQVRVSIVQSDIAALLARWRSEQVRAIHDHVLLDLRRVDRLLAAVWTQALAGDPHAVTQALRCLDYRARLLGYAGRDLSVHLALHGDRGSVEVSAAVRDGVPADGEDADAGRLHAYVQALVDAGLVRPADPDSVLPTRADAQADAVPAGV